VSSISGVIGGWRVWILVLATLAPDIAMAQNFTGYRATTLDAFIEQWNQITKNDGPGVSWPPEPLKIKFVAKMRSAPAPCSNAALEVVLTMINWTDLLRKVSITHCFTFSSSSGRLMLAYVQDVLVPGLKSDARIGGPLEIYADFFAFQVDADRSRNVPILLVSRFEPQ
jgi:hypothetical protein